MIHKDQSEIFMELQMQFVWIMWEEHAIVKTHFKTGQIFHYWEYKAKF